MIKLNFNTPLPNDQQIPCIHGFKQLGFRVEREFQNGNYILYRFYGRLPTVTGKTDIDILFSESAQSDFKTVKDIDWIEFYLMFERKNNDYKS